uniref:Microtubule-associated tumor suppressor 1 n=1 Tax=Hymenolepis diminuta TaxID=6216 RepID=A0A0R3SIY3_HYMDI
LKEDFKAKSPLTAPSTSGKRYSVGPSTLSVPKGSVKYPLKLTSRFSVSPTSLVGIQTAKSGSSSKDMGCQKETPKEQDKPNPSRSDEKHGVSTIYSEAKEIYEESSCIILTLIVDNPQSSGTRLGNAPPKS